MTSTIEHPFFVDTNVVVYVFTAGGEKADRSEQILESGAVVSVQVLNEAALTLRRKFKASWSAIREMSASLRTSCRVVDLSEATHVCALDIAERYQLNIYDANIAAAALLAGCRTLLSEDMHDGLVIDGLTIKNPYAGLA